jgi:hypothetical protein
MLPLKYQLFFHSDNQLVKFLLYTVTLHNNITIESISSGQFRFNLLLFTFAIIVQIMYFIDNLQDTIKRFLIDNICISLIVWIQTKCYVKKLCIETK